jgi:hypothetical protein
MKTAEIHVIEPEISIAELCLSLESETVLCIEPLSFLKRDVVLTAIPVKAVQLLAILFMYAAMLYSLFSAFFMGRKIKKLVAEKFPNEPLKGIGIYGWLRSTQMRRMRAPSPQVKRGDSF